VSTSSKGRHQASLLHIEHANALFQEDRLTTLSATDDMLNVSQI